MEKLELTEDVSMKLRVHPNTLKRWVYEGKIRAYKVGKSFGFKDKDVEEFLEKKQVLVD